MNYKRVKQLLKLENKGATIRFIKPQYITEKYLNLKERMKAVQEKLDQQAHKHLLPKYPVDKSKGSGVGKIRRSNIIRPKKVIFDPKKSNL